MTMRRTRVFRQPSRLALPALAAALAVMAGAAKAEPNPYTFKISETLTYDDNLYRLPTNELKEAISSTALSFGLDQPIGRQRLLANATVRHDIYKENSNLDNTGYDIGAGLEWEAASRWAGDAKFRFTRALASFEDYGDLTGNLDKNEEDVASVSLRAVYGLVSTWGIQGTYEHFDVGYSQAAFADRERNSDSFGLGVLYRPSGVWTFGLSGRWTQGEYPHYNGNIKDEFDRRDLDLTAKYFVTGLSTLSARLSHTNEDHDVDATRNFSGLTGQIDWDYQATGKLGFRTTLARETGSGPSAFSNSGGTPGYLSDSSLTTRLGVAAKWAATAKITVRAGFEYWHDRYDAQFTGTGGTSSADDSAASRSVSLSALYEATRAVSFECGARYQKRDELITADATFFGYTATTAYCNGTLALN